MEQKIDQTSATDAVYDARTLGLPKMGLLGVQHLFAMFGATVLVPLLTGLSVSATLLFAGLGTLLFHLVTKRIVPAFLGITEPVIFGINLRLMKPFLYALVGGACAGGLASFLHLAGTGMGITVLPGTLLYLDHLGAYILVNVVGFAVAFALTYLFFRPEED